MVQSDFKKFAERWSAMSEMQRGGKLSDPAIMMTFSMLSEYEFGEVTEAMTKHCKVNKWMPAPAEIIQQIKGELPDDEYLVGLTTTLDTPLGVYVRSLLGSDAATMNLRDQCQRLAMHRESITKFVERAQAGEYTDRDIRLIGGKGIDIRSPLCAVLSGPRKKHHEQLASRQASLVVKQVAVDDLPDVDEETREANKIKMKQLMRDCGL